MLTSEEPKVVSIRTKRQPRTCGIDEHTYPFHVWGPRSTPGARCQCGQSVLPGLRLIASIDRRMEYV